MGNCEQIAINSEDHSTCGWFTEEEAVQLNDTQDDEEVAVIKKGFALLSGKKLVT